MEFMCAVLMNDDVFFPKKFILFNSKLSFLEKQRRHFVNEWMRHVQHPIRIVASATMAV